MDVEQFIKADRFMRVTLFAEESNPRATLPRLNTTVKPLN